METKHKFDRERKIMAKWDLKKKKIKSKKKKSKKKQSKYKSYSDYLHSKQWKYKRKRILEQRGFKCEKCQSTTNLQVHHLTYKNIFHEKDIDLQVLCRFCHAKIHGKI